MGFYTETVCSFKAGATFYICRTIQKSEYRIPTILRTLDSIMVLGTHHREKKLLMQQEQKKRVRIKMQNGCEEHRKGIKANHIRWPHSGGGTST